MIEFALTILVVFLLVALAEAMWHYHDLDPEYTRKFVHISVGTFVAFWPLFLSNYDIVGLSLAFVVVIGGAYYFKLFQAIQSVQRPTWGEIFFALAVGFLAIVSSSGWIYMVAVLHMSLADGLAAIIGAKFGKRTRYAVFGHEKSLVGTATFIAVSLLIFTAFFALTPNPFTLWCIPIALAAAAIENLAVMGLDNLLVPLAVALSLNFLR